MIEKLLKAPRKGCPVGFPGPTACSVCVPWTCPTLPTAPWLLGLRPPVSSRCSPEPHWLRPGCLGPGEGPGLLPGGEALWESFLNLLHSISWSNPALQPGALVPLCWGSPGRDPSGHEHLGGSSHCVAFSRAWGAQEIQEYLVEDSDKEAEMGQS